MGRLFRAACLVVGTGLTSGLSSGCAYTVRLLSEPDGARVHLPDGVVVTTPGQVQLRTTPFRAYPVLVELPGYRALEVDLQRTHGRALVFVEAAVTQGGDREVTFLLEPVHPPPGGTEPR